jgi:hypothetical protein
MNEIEPFKFRVMGPNGQSNTSGGGGGGWFSVRGAVFFYLGMLIGYVFIGF